MNQMARSRTFEKYIDGKAGLPPLRIAREVSGEEEALLQSGARWVMDLAGANGRYGTVGRQAVVVDDIDTAITVIQQAHQVPDFAFAQPYLLTKREHPTLAWPNGSLCYFLKESRETMPLDLQVDAVWVHSTFIDHDKAVEFADTLQSRPVSIRRVLMTEVG